ncbi:MAG: tRNA (adenosine(37)-N6)-threonylcarbamoyltransferase complex transferase subunit TsaD [Eubacteriales bacterium]|nr:tRNA (adenosine(37)-N6)-threonylcarbamoyltransferase complex transferase subunit TsaD [Eubacteriales bacterium]
MRTILAIETSCDETAAAVTNGRDVLGSAVYTQKEHEKYGGVVPEIASRNHIVKLPYIIDDALECAGVGFGGLDAIAVTDGPGLIGALLVGVAYAKALAYYFSLPLIPVHHIEGHICSLYISHKELGPPFICLVVSGGHTHIAVVEDYGKYRLVAKTRDDAVGEAFDKTARALGLGYPGGPKLEALAREGTPIYRYTRGFRAKSHLDFTFSGLKTAVINQMHNMDQKGESYSKADIAASFQHEAISFLVDNTFEAAAREGIDKIGIAGGVSSNGALRMAFDERAKRQGIALYLPEPKYCTDNAAMIGCAAGFLEPAGDPMGLNADASKMLF